MRLLNALAVVAAFGIANLACAQSPETEAPNLSAKWVSSLVGMHVTTPTGTYLGKVKDVVVDGYDRPTYAIISYGGTLGLGSRYTAVPWMSVAEMLQNDKLLVDQSQLENAPTLAGAKPQSLNTRWRHAADNYWRGKVALGPTSPKAPAAPGARAAATPAETPAKESN